MTAKEKINRNIGLTFDFLRQIVEKPGELNKIPSGTVIEFVDKDFPKIFKKGHRNSRGTKYIAVKSKLEII
jgi:hypothetical protein